MTSEGFRINDMAHVSREEVLNKLEATDTDSVSVFDTEAMTVGLKRYSEEPAEAKGTRKHTEDELYYILSGAGTMRVGEETHSVAAGDLLYIEQGASHNIVKIDDELTVLKIFTD